MRKLLLTSTIALLGLTSTAEAHFILMSPAPTNPGEASGGKGSPPCGPDAAPAAMPTAAQGGHAIMLMLKETVPHDGFYRVALGIKSRSEIPVDNVVYDGSKPPKILPPTGMPSGTSDHADFQNPAVFPVLADNLFPHTGTGMMMFAASIMLPNVTCDRCTLQVIEFMRPHGFNTSVNPGPGGGYFYHHCAELKITADPALPAFVAPGADGGAPDVAAPKDASAEVAGPGTAGASGTGVAGAAGTGTAGAGGSAGVAGTSGTAGAGAGGSTMGSAGATGSAGSSTTGTAGAAGTGTAGTTGAAGTHSSGGGCSVAGGGITGASVAFGVLFVAILATRRRRYSRAKS
jgi:hypothetical protein